MKNSNTSSTVNKMIPIMICMLLAYLFVLLFSTTTSPLYISNPYWHHGDSGIFQEIGLVIARGGVPYVDVFDHKGPVLFFIQALGLLINEHWGIFVLQGMSLFVTLWCWYKIISVFQKKIWIVFGIILIALIFLLGYYQRGNMCEEWSLPFISLPILLFIKHSQDQLRISCKEWFFVGIFTCTVIFIRANNIAPILGFAIFSIVADLRADKKLAAWNILYGLLGCLVVACFWILLFYFVYGRDALSWMIYGTFLYNFDYIQKGMDLGLWHNIWFYTSIGLFVVISIVETKSQKRFVSVPLLVSYLISVLAIGSNKFIHYTTIFIPLFVVSMSIIHSVRWFHVLLVSGSLIQAIDTGKSGLDLLAVRCIKDTPKRASYDDFDRWIMSIPESERNNIYNYYALPTYYFAEEKIVQQNRCVMKSHLDCSSRILNIEKIDGFNQKKPIWVLVASDISQIDDMDQVILREKYLKQDSVLGYDDHNVVCCYKRKDYK